MFLYFVSRLWLYALSVIRWCLRWQTLHAIRCAPHTQAIGRQTANCIIFLSCSHKKMSSSFYFNQDNQGTCNTFWHILWSVVKVKKIKIEEKLKKNIREKSFSFNSQTHHHDDFYVYKNSNMTLTVHIKISVDRDRHFIYY